MHDSGIDVKAIIDEVARRHHVRLAPDDPILAIVTATDLGNKLFAAQLERLVEGVANQATGRLAAEIEKSRREVPAQSDAAKVAVSKLMNDAGARSAETLKEASASAAADIKAAVAASLSAVQADITAAQKAKVTAIWAPVVALVIGGLFLGGAIGFWLAGR